MSVNGKQPSLCRWMGLAGSPVFDKLWHLSDSVAAWTPFGRLTHYCWSLCGFLHLCFSPFFCCYFWLFIGLRWHGSRMETVRRVTDGSWFEQWKAFAFQILCHLCDSSVLLFSPSSLGYLDSGLITQPSTTGSVPVRQLFGVGVCQSSQVGCQLFSPSMKNIREGLCVSFSQNKLILMSMWRPVKFLDCHSPDSDRQNVLSVGGTK